MLSQNDSYIENIFTISNDPKFRTSRDGRNYKKIIVNGTMEGRIKCWLNNQQLARQSWFFSRKSSPPPQGR